MTPQIAAFLKALGETEYLPPDRMQAYQRRLLERLLRHARSEAEFYRGRLDPIFAPDGTIEWERWQELPVLTRSEAQEAGQTLHAHSLPPAAGEAVEDTSSGSTGTPFKHLATEIQQIASAACSERFFRWHELDPAKLTARIRAASNPETLYPKGRPTTGWRIGHPDSRVIDLSIAANTEQQLEWLKRISPAYLASYPTNLRELADTARRAGERLRFDRLMTFGEMLTEDAREAIRDYFATEPVDRYGASEIGHIAGTCPHSLKHHLSAEVVLMEILDEENRPVEPGNVGRVVLTPFYNFAMPLIRYDVGDWGAMSGEPCGCGRTLPVIDRIMGRTRNVFRFVDGTSVWPVLLSSGLRKFVPARQYQIVQRSLTEIDVVYVPEHPGQSNDLAGLADYVRGRLHPSVTVTATPAEQIARSAGGKFEDYVSLVARSS